MADAHAILAPSSAARTVQCPASVTLQQRYPDQGDDEAAREGTAAHWVLEQTVEGVILQAGSLAPNGVVVTPDMLGGARTVVADMMEKLGPDWRSLVHIEQTLPADPALHPECWGTPDAWALHNGTLYVWDYKYGFLPVDPYENWQLITYFALLLRMLGVDDQRLTVRFTIAQPRDYSSKTGTLKTWTAHASHLRAQVNVLRNAFGEALGPAPRYRTGPECDNCSARHACPQLQREGLRAADLVQHAAPVDLQPMALSTELAVLEAAMVTLKARVTGLQEQAVRMLKWGTQIPGYALGYGQSRTVWTAPAANVINTGRLVGVDLAKPVEPITPKQALDAGMPAELVKSMSAQTQGVAKLVRDDPNAAATAFGS